MAQCVHWCTAWLAKTRGRRNRDGRRSVFAPYHRKDRHMGKGCLLWLLGVPIPVIIVLWLIFR